ncbi:E3 ubiquitin-protein ligase NRDP1 [Drosophila rhopaloa]|uniref:E3 ubiquitin-protein ligase NRDP1 n=1 Tax=Drosophila rhopaloa TaxID=1041015 RepID=A0ABM5I3S0_DRORH|nr:E3 ubiquitin-protein ligase NRDP1 [Drosophila rhopaloa]XP_044316036.1 E3 ubiquitin-protein ligase NRDP1 [Drosophila rhopaloa]
MGFDLNSIVGHVDEELICPICADVLEEPVQSSGCEHAYCRACIDKWMLQKQICPVDRSALLAAHLVPVSRLMRNMLSRLKIKCTFSANGCPLMLPLEEFRTHVVSCEHNPKVVVLCNKGCGMKVPKDELARHNCVFELRELVHQQIKEISELKVKQASEELLIVSQRRELELLQYYIAALRSTNPVLRNIGEQLDRYSLMQWGNGLPLATVRTWGSLISTPDTPMHVMVRDGLRSCGCPMHMLNLMVDRCHEDRWPEGLMTLDLRRENHHQLGQYVTRLVPSLASGKPCVVVLGGDNIHMPENLRPSLGLVMIFVDGVDEMVQEALPDSEFL